MPRLREPTPPKYIYQKSDSEDEEAVLDCKSCIKFKNKYLEAQELNN